MVKAGMEATSTASGYFSAKAAIPAEWSGSMCCTMR